MEKMGCIYCIYFVIIIIIIIIIKLANPFLVEDRELLYFLVYKSPPSPLFFF